MSPAKLDRTLSRRDLVGLTINLIIGAGIFGLPSKLFATAGPWSIVAVMACGALVALVVLCFAEVGSRFDRTGGPYLYARETFGDTTGFVIGWLMVIRSLTSFGAICNLLVSYLGILWPWAATGPGRVWIACTAAAVLTIIVVRGIRGSATWCNALALAKTLPLLAFIAIGLAFVHPDRLALGPWPGVDAFSSAVLPLVFAFAGFDATLLTSGEMRQPRRDVAFALLVSLGVVALLYVLIQVVCVGTLPELAGSERPLAEAAGRFLGPGGSRAIAVGALFSTFGALLATVLTAPRVWFALAEHEQFPRWLAATHPRFHTPHVAIVLAVACMLVVTLTGSFIYAVTINAMIRLILYIMTAVALLVLRGRPNAPPAGYRAPAGALVASAAVLLCLWVLSQSTAREARDLAIATAVGLVIHLGYRTMAKVRRRPPAKARFEDAE